MCCLMSLIRLMSLMAVRLVRLCEIHETRDLGARDIGVSGFGCKPCALISWRAPQVPSDLNTINLIN